MPQPSGDPGAAAGMAGGASARPNVLLVVTDQQHPDLVGALGRFPVQTPAEDRLCAEGMALRRAYAASPLCAPSRMSIVSGQYPSRHGVWTNGVPARYDMLSLPRLLREGAGYRTALIGKSHFRPGRPEKGVEFEWTKTPKDEREIPYEGLPYDWEALRAWDGPWYGFEHARMNTGHAFNWWAYSLHYAAWLDERGIKQEDHFMTREGAAAALSEQLTTTTATPADMTLGTPVPPPMTWDLPEELHHSAWVADETIAFLREHASSHPEAPFFVSANFPDPHSPFVVPRPWDTLHDGAEIPPPVRKADAWRDRPAFHGAVLERRELDGGWHEKYKSVGPIGLLGPEERTPRELRWWWTYMGMQSLVDHHLGRMLDELDRLGLAENTLVIFTSDHGDMMGDHFFWHKGGVHYDACVRVPLLVRWPGRVPAGVQSSSLQSLVDLAPTIMAAAGLDPHEEMQGVDQLPAWSDPAVTTREGVLVEHRIEHGLDLNTWITDRHRLSVYSDLAHDRDELELYDLQQDPGELHDLHDDPGSKGDLADLFAEAWRSRSRIAEPLPERVSSGMG
jgi:arylsulfatase A-like enzyme